MTKQPKVRKPHPVLHGIGLVLSVILLVAVLVGTYLLSTMATIIDSFIGAPSGHYSKTEIADTKLKAEALAAEVGAARIVRVVDPYAGGLILLLEADELDVEQREQLPAAASVVPLLVAVHRIEVVDADDADVFGHGPVERVGQLVERAERVGRMQMGVDIDRLDLVSFR